MFLIALREGRGHTTGLPFARRVGCPRIRSQLKPASVQLNHAGKPRGCLTAPCSDCAFLQRFKVIGLGFWRGNATDRPLGPRSAPLVRLGERQGQPGRVIQPSHLHQAGDRRKRSLTLDSDAVQIRTVNSSSLQEEQKAMRRLALITVLTVMALSAWIALVALGTLNGWGRPTLAQPKDTQGFMSSASQLIDTRSNGNAAFALIEGGRLFDEHFVSIGQPVDRNTLFQVASVSKWITTWGVLTLVESGRIDLDAPVSQYLTRWTLPPSSFDNDGVTVRRLLSHTAGLTDGLGYAGFVPRAEIQTLEQSLTRASDASPGAVGAVQVGAPPGGGWNYSGGGYTLLQLVIEEVSGESFNSYMQRAVLQPLEMSRSSFELSDEAESNIAEFYDTDGTLATHYQFTATAAASLYTSAADLTRFMQAHLAGPNGEPPGRGVLRPETLVEMRRPHAFQYGAEIWGLGVVLYAPNNAGDFIVGHDGANAPAINTTARFDPTSGDGIIVLATGNTRLATELAGDWVFWRTGNVDLFDVIKVTPRALLILAIGFVLILAAGIFAAWKLKRGGARHTV